MDPNRCSLDNHVVEKPITCYRERGPLRPYASTIDLSGIKLRNRCPTVSKCDKEDKDKDSSDDA